MHSYHPVPPRESFEGKSPSARMYQCRTLVVRRRCGGWRTGMHAGQRTAAAAAAGTDESPGSDSARCRREQTRRLTARLRSLVRCANSRRRARPTRHATCTTIRTSRRRQGLSRRGMHSESLIVRTAAATAAIDTTGPRDDVRALLEDAAASRDADVRELARTALARGMAGSSTVAPLRTIGAMKSGGGQSRPIQRSSVTARGRRNRRGGSRAVTSSVPRRARPSFAHAHESFGWSGDYSEAQRSLAANDLAAWIPAQSLNEPDYSRTVMESQSPISQRSVACDSAGRCAWPRRSTTNGCRHLANVSKIIDIRVRADLVIIADRGGQRLPRTCGTIRRSRSCAMAGSATRPHTSRRAAEGHGLADEL